MKKIVMGIAAIAMAASVFAVDFAAKVTFEGTLAGGTIDNTEEKDASGKVINKGKDNALYFWQLNKTTQHSGKDFLTLTGNGDKAGGSVGIGYNYDNSPDPDNHTQMDLQVRSASLWFKPIDMLKITVGSFETPVYRNMLDYWKDPVGASLGEWSSWAAKYNSSAAGNGTGLLLEATPVSGLSVTGSLFASKTDTKFANFTNDSDKISNIAVTGYGVGAKYDLNGLISQPITAGIFWTDNGNSKKTTKQDSGDHYDNAFNPKLLAIGVDYGNNYAPGFYGMLNARMRFEQKDTKNAAGEVEKSGLELTGVTIDNYFKYSVDAFTAMFRAPITIRTKAYDSKDDKQNKIDKYADPSFFDWSAKVQYALSGFTPYFSFGSTAVGNDIAWVLQGNPSDDIAEKDANGKIKNANGFTENFGLELKPGVSFSVGAANLDVGIVVTLPKGILTEDSANINWSVPFSAQISL